MPCFENKDFILETPKEPKINLLILHGICEYSERYKELIEKFKQQDIQVAAIDHPGHGKSLNSSQNFQEDFYKVSQTLTIDEIIDYQISFLNFLYDQKYFSKDLPLLLFGQSMGGLIATKLSLKIQTKLPQLKGVILLSPAFKPIATKNSGFINLLRFKVEQVFLNKCWSCCTGNSPIFKNTILKNILKINPAVDSARAEAAISDLAEVNKAFASDPFIGRKISLQFLHSILKNMVSVIDAKEKFKLPYFLSWGDKDKIVAGQGSKEFVEKNLDETQRCFVKEYKDFFPHELHNSSRKEEVISDMLKWIKALEASDSQ
ncbi:MAG: lysophospholipase [Lentisphaeraceae bacterium]|nr:lysophospholipase [Lentisphaeraceae bacterium]